ncbi:MAG: VTT domain-containing protein, partial [Candidatus Yanofskybacteria bacterium]|nr:VTT domain-containing protein [Candidatus Yanofskybacteria bacterium]
MASKKITSWLSLAVIAALFIISAYASQKYESQIVQFVEGKTGWVILSLYLLLTIVSEVISPIASLPFIPIAVSVWGSLGAGLLTAAGWTLGSIMAFLFARWFGHTLLPSISSKKILEKIHRYAPEDAKEVFWLLVILRIFAPIDYLSYAAGLFTHISLKTYSLATVIGIIPSAMIFSYLGGLPFVWQLFGIALGIIALLLVIPLL